MTLVEVKGANIAEYLARVMAALESTAITAISVVEPVLIDDSTTSIHSTTLSDSMQTTDSFPIAADVIETTNIAPQQALKIVSFFGIGKHTAKAATLNELLKRKGVETRLEVTSIDGDACLRGIVLR